MSQPHPSPIQARALQASEQSVSGFSLYHERYRGFAAVPHSHDHWQVLIPLAGRMHLTLGDADYLLAPEWGVVLQPGIRHGFSFIDGEMAFLAVNLPDGGWQAVTAAGVRQPVVRDVRLWLLGKLLAAELDAPGPDADEAVMAGLRQMAIYLGRAQRADSAPALVAEPRILQAVDRIVQGYAEPLTVAGLAESLAMSQRHFERRFREALGLSPRQFLIDVRLSAARELLATTDRSVADVAFDVGFSNVSHFSDTFHARVGQSPRAFRQGAAKAVALFASP